MPQLDSPGQVLKEYQSVPMASFDVDGCSRNRPLCPGNDEDNLVLYAVELNFFQNTFIWVIELRLIKT